MNDAFRVHTKLYPRRVYMRLHTSLDRIAQLEGKKTDCHVVLSWWSGGCWTCPLLRSTSTSVGIYTCIIISTYNSTCFCQGNYPYDVGKFRLGEIWPCGTRMTVAHLLSDCCCGTNTLDELKYFESSYLLAGITDGQRCQHSHAEYRS